MYLLILVSTQWSCVFGSSERRFFFLLKASQAAKVVEGVLMVAMQQRGIQKNMSLSKQIACQARLFAGFFSAFHNLLSSKTSFSFWMLYQEYIPLTACGDACQSSPHKKTREAITLLEP